MRTEYGMSVRQVLTHGFEQWRADVTADGQVVSANNFWSEAYARHWAERQVMALIAMSKRSERGVHATGTDGVGGGRVGDRWGSTRPGDADPVRPAGATRLD